ncbi:hypothetical protein L2E82_20518 [Cichorium intybus]|uniref:Uncharacterized protein n=1 Tax=Cichorium intybus TaxID=13427 RepID=A0ACB9DUC4_CICIN|nr:hypothetical protein L2E82_20518 [Cichorium intybus]
MNTTTISVAGIAPLKPPPGRPDLALKTPPGMKDLVVPPLGLNTASPPSRSLAGGAATTPVLSPSLTPSGKAPPPPSGKARLSPPPLKQGLRLLPPPYGAKASPRSSHSSGIKLWQVPIMAVWHQIRAG